jgi:hypothetical protein
LANPAGLRLLEHRAIPQVPQDRPFHEQPGSFDDARRYALDGRLRVGGGRYGRSLSCRVGVG